MSTLENDLNLRIFPLKIVENIVIQKCLIPKQKIPAAIRAGNRAKCFLSDTEFIVCQVFPRNMPLDLCYMDDCVSNVDNSIDAFAERKLVRLKLLNECAVTVPEVEVVLTIAETLFLQSIDKLTLAYLQNSIQLLLQSLYLTPNCIVKLPEFAQMGITAIRLKSAKGCSSDEFFQITDETVVSVNDVQLLASWLDMSTFHRCGFERALEELNDLLTIEEMQRHKRIGGFRLSLNALLVGATGCGKSTLAAAFIRQRSLNCFRIRAADVLGQYPGETEAELRRIFKAARVFVCNLKPAAPTVILLEDIHLLCPATRTADTTDVGNSMRICAQLLSLVDDLRQGGQQIICLATTTVPEALSAVARSPGGFEHEIAIAVPTEAQRAQFFSALFQQTYICQSLGATIAAETLNFVANQTQGYVAADLALLVRTIEQAFLSEGSTHELTSAVKAALLKSRPISVKSSDVTVSKTTEGFDIIGGMQTLKRVLEVAVIAALQQRTAFQRFGLNLPKGILLYGPPGCAKTTIAKCLAKEANCNFIATSGAEVYSPYVGCAEKFIAKIFDTARKHAPCLIFLDEIDTLVGRRTMAASAASNIQVRILATLLTEMDGIVTTANAKHILVVAATNRPDMVDNALLRPGRFDKLIHVPAPDYDSRLALLKLYARRMPFASDVNLSGIAENTLNYSGADICNLCNEAALQTFQRDFNATQIGAADFEYVLGAHKSSLSQQQIDWYLNFEQKLLT